MKMDRMTTTYRFTQTTPLFIKRAFISALLVLAFPLAGIAQQTVFYDTFGSSTLNGVSTNSGTPTASSTSYDIASAKNASATSIASGNLSLITSATSSG